MKTLKLLIKTSFFNKINVLCASILSNKSLMEEATKCLFCKSGTHRGLGPCGVLTLKTVKFVKAKYSQIWEICAYVQF